MDRVTVNTVAEYERWSATAHASGLVSVLQVGSKSCVRCPQFEEAIRGLNKEYQFRWGYSDAHNEDTDIPEHFAITKLPAFVLQTANADDPVVVANSSIDQLTDAVKGACTPVLELDVDF